MSKKVQIDYELFLALYDYFCGTGSDENFIRSSLEQKHKKMVEHSLYSLSKNNELSDEVRDKMKEMYYDSIQENY